MGVHVGTRQYLKYSHCLLDPLCPDSSKINSVRFTRHGTILNVNICLIILNFPNYWFLHHGSCDKKKCHRGNPFTTVESP